MKQREYVSTGGVYEDGYQKSNIPPTTNMSKNESFEKNGYIFIPALVVDPENMYCAPPLNEKGERLTGQLKYIRSDKVRYNPDENQVNGSLARYNVPMYKQLHYLVRKEIEKRLGMDLLPTYFYDRFYYVGQQLKRHRDRPSCEVSVTLQISTNSDKPWPIWFQRPDGSESYVLMKNGDAAIYKGCEREHWRDPLESKYSKIENLWRTFRKKEDDTYHHQIFLHYVNAQGPFVHYGNDR
tara:strand:- start:354 stop:1070 length:717 start_codon:yes stop_codon:yes gene_type:complete